MKKHRIQMVVAATVIGAMSLVVVPSAGFGVAPFPKLTQGYYAWLARAMDPCTPAGMSVTTAFLPGTGCLAATSDPTMTMNYGIVRVTQRGKISIFGTGFTPLTSQVRVRLTLRVTKKNQNTKHPPGVNTVTYADKTIDCPKSPGAFISGTTGAIVGSTDLSACLSGPPNNTGLSTGNLEIIGASLVDVNTTKVIGTSGVLR